MRTYDKTKYSGIEWIGELPESWSISKIKYLPAKEPLSFIDGDWIQSKDIVFEEGIRYITTGNIGEGIYKEQGHSFITEETFINLNCTEVFPGDLLISRLNRPIGRSCIIPDLGFRIVTSVDNVIFRPKGNLHKGYLNFLMNSNKYYDYTELIARGATMQRISRGLLSEIKIPIPPLSEQTAIANYLDAKTTEIDQTIADKEALINLFEEEKKALINEAVTKGLNSKAKLKPSGIDWLGDIPEHWEVKKLKHIGNLKSGETITSELITYEDSFPVYGGNGLRGYTPSYTHEGNFILIGRQGALCGNINYAKGKFWASEHAIVVTINSDFEYIWLGELLKEMNLNQYSLASAQPGLAVDRIQNLHIPVPPIKEQTAIVKYIQTETTTINEKINLTKQEIELLKEYRQALIFEAVTGKICVL